MKNLLWVGVVVFLANLCECADLNRILCAPGCSEQTHNSSSLLSFLYPGGNLPLIDNTVSELRLPLRIGLSFLPSQGAHGGAQLDAAHREELLE